MIAKNNSFFDIELCVDGHYIVTGYTNDQFCNDVLQLSDVKYELHNYLRNEQGFEAVFFLDSVDMLWDRTVIMQNGVVRSNITREELSADERQTTFTNMMKIALAVAVKMDALPPLE